MSSARMLFLWTLLSVARKCHAYRNGKNPFSDFANLLVTDVTLCNAASAHYGNTFACSEETASHTCFSNDYEEDATQSGCTKNIYDFTIASISHGTDIFKVNTVNQFQKINIDTAETFVSELRRIRYENPMTIEFALHFGGLNTLHKGEITAQAVKEINNQLIQRGWHLISSSAKARELQEYLMEETRDKSYSFLTMWNQNLKSLLS